MSGIDHGAYWFQLSGIVAYHRVLFFSYGALHGITGVCGSEIGF
jgi:hypothetical protein